jgi:hypothetical protein
VSTRFFSGEEGERDGRRVPARESQQALLLRLLRQANGTTVSYDRLRDAGIELPASVVSELELAGFPIERRYEGAGGPRGRPGVRLNPALDPERPPPETPTAASVQRKADRNSDSRRRSAMLSRLPKIGVSVVAARRSSFPNRGRSSVGAARRWSELRPTARALAPLALFAAMVVVIAVIVVALETSHVNSRQINRHQVPRPHPRSTGVVARAPQTSPAQSPATPISLTLATQFEAQGHDLLQSGRYGNAVPVLRRALAATGKQLDDCLTPVSESCLTYAYALYDLGRALELGGDPGAAVPVLQKRLQIDNQRDVVAAELERARTIVPQ